MGHLHLVLNHFPVIGLVFCIVLLGYGLKENSNDVKIASLKMFVLIAVLTLGAYFTGESAEEMVEHMPGVTKKMIEEHEEAGTVALILIEVMGVGSAVGLYLYRKTKALNAMLVKGLFVLAIVSVLLSGYVANMGGQIRHTEIRSGAPVATEGAKGK